MKKSGLPEWIRLDDDRILISTSRACEFYGVSRKTLNSWALRGCPKETRGWWDVQLVTTWLMEREGIGSKDSEDLNQRKLKADTEYREAKAAREQLMKELAEGKYFPKDEVVGEWVRRVHEVRTAMLATPRKVAAVFSDPEIRVTVESELTTIVREILERYAREGVYTPKSTVAARGKKRVSSSGKAHRKRVGGQASRS